MALTSSVDRPRQKATEKKRANNNIQNPLLSRPPALSSSLPPPLLTTPAFAARDDPLIEYCPHCYNARGPKYVKERAVNNIDPAVLDAYGGPNEFPLYYAEFADNGNYLEPDEIAVRHGICGDPEQVRDLSLLCSRRCGG